MRYRQLTSEERYALSTLRKQGFSAASIGKALGRHRSTIVREVARNARNDGGYRPSTADDLARWRRSRSRRNQRFGATQWALVQRGLEQHWSPEQISGRYRRRRILGISHETIYRYIWRDWFYGGTLHRYLRGARKQLRKRYGRYDSRGRLAGKRMIQDRPIGAENRSRVGHLEGDTIIGGLDRHCVLTLVDRKTGYVLIGKLSARNVEEANQQAIALIRNAPRRTMTMTVDNGTEFHGYRALEQATGIRVYFATPHHAWERGTSENTNGLIRQYLPKRVSMAKVTQQDCARIANVLNNRPRKRLGFLTPTEVYEEQKRK